MSIKEQQDKRPIDRLANNSYSWYGRTLLAIKTSQVKTWQAFLIILFVSGFFLALIWSANANLSNEVSAASSSRNFIKLYNSYLKKIRSKTPPTPPPITSTTTPPITSTTTESAVALGLSHPGFSTTQEANFSLEKINDLNVKIIRITESWKNREPVKGTFYWAPLDQRIDFIKSNNLSLLMTIEANGPDWACSAVKNDKSCVYNNDSDFENFVTELVKRYANKIDKIQFANEFDGEENVLLSSSDLVKYNNFIYDLIKTYSPNTKVVLGSLTRYSPIIFLACDGNFTNVIDTQGNLLTSAQIAYQCKTTKVLDAKAKVNYVLQNADYDMVDIHMYDDQENWDEYIDWVKSVTSKDIIVSEFGGPNVLYEPYTPEYQATKMLEYLNKLASLPIKEAYYFKLNEGGSSPQHAKSYLFDSSGNEMPAYQVFREFLRNR